ncbi:transmembrane emp24 domain-containing protein p24delta3-like [Pyrus ussuriensis x Pyrus communis]|uniref:Transmembrane emp24 domain-containing protein p24delta3-like n=1 Tax=Pyrus ussuriensis x Pyrus communis TaxID=2448454 RepID=A0A5N5FB98_9ROSA|nr:transmembrane emp24 domain-containing protein p24delta3-like [Pyrus ussuriensis x Pyrus communis]
MLAAMGMGTGARIRTEREEGEIGGMDMEGLTNIKLGIERRMRVMEKNGEMDMEEGRGQEREKRGMKNSKSVAALGFF